MSLRKSILIQKKEILGTDIKAYLNQENFKVKKENKPRIFSNTVQLNKNESKFSKSVFTLCNYRADDKCPPWTFQAKEMLHDKIKNIFYENAIIKIYDIPIFFLLTLLIPILALKEDLVFYLQVLYIPKIWVWIKCSLLFCN